MDRYVLLRKLQMGLLRGIPVQFATAMQATTVSVFPLGAAGVASSAPHAVAVGGTAILNKVGNTGYFPLGWGQSAELGYCRRSPCRAAKMLVNRLEARLPDQGKSTYTRWADVEVEKMSSLIGRQFVVGTDMMLARVLLEKGAHVPLHSHHNEQITYILEGALKFLLEGKEVVVRAGEVLCIPPHVPHEAFALEDTVDLDVFNPPRQDWIDRDDAYLRSETGANIEKKG